MAVSRPILIGAIIVLCIVFLMWSNPLRESEENIRNYVLERTPLGSDFSEVLTVIRENKWTVIFVNESSGFYHQGRKEPTVIGQKSIRASLGDYQDIPFRANVTVFWGFDDEGRLLDIWVWKTWNGL
ncbi:hypothetical protein [Halopseudomonas yangmingensis]|uniref:hypothetical protein n=1 Tax=Halopseudomonas yangmingensis TaxID=1720063 RepID=UPI0011609081|nr:hypothetical protein [Halopseudomonas yangmingensis]